MPFAIRAISDGKIDVRPGASAGVKFEVTNLSDNAVHARFRILDENEGEPDWAKVSGELLQDLKPREALSVDVDIAIPGDAEENSQRSFRLFVNNTEDVKDIGEGKQMTVRVGQPAPPKRSLLWLWILLGVVGVAAIVVTIIVLTGSKPKPLDVAFAADPNPAHTGEKVTFTAEAKGEAKAYIWDFGDGSDPKETTEATASHTYTTEGTFPVGLVIRRTGKDKDDPEIEEVQDEKLEVVVHTQAKAAFTARPTKGRAPMKVRFQNASSAGTYAWDFGDGSKSTDENPEHTYRAQGSYTVKLTVKCEGDDNSATASQKIFVEKEGVARFAVKGKTVGDAPLNVQFADQSVGAKTWSWDFGNQQSSKSQNPATTYTKPGTYTVVLEIETGSGKKERVEKTKLIRVYNKPRISLSGSKLATRGHYATFNYSIAGDVRSAELIFAGQGKKAISPRGRTYRHKFPKNGVYTVTLRVVGLSGIAYTSSAVRVTVENPVVHKLAWNSGFLKPRRTKGDTEFKGHGPKMYGSAAVYLHGGQVKANIYYKAEETKSNWSTAIGGWNNLKVYSPPRGFRINRLLPASRFAGSSSFTSSSHSTMKKNLSKWGYLEFRGDHRGGDIGSWTAIRLVLTGVLVELVRD
ncbi:MAG: PKD domain-containing protein [Planctomycetota bacterium]|jgi:PKD repeat protein